MGLSWYRSYFNSLMDRTIMQFRSMAQRWWEVRYYCLLNGSTTKSVRKGYKTI